LKNLKKESEIRNNRLAEVEKSFSDIRACSIKVLASLGPKIFGGFGGSIRPDPAKADEIYEQTATAAAQMCAPRFR
jgi:hypothetical protein